MGAVSSIGIGLPAFLAGLRAGRCAAAPIEAFDTTGFEYAIGCEIADFAPERWISTLPVDTLGRATQFSVSAARMAVADAGLAAAELRRRRGLIAIGTTDGEARDLDRLVETEVRDSPAAMDPGLARRVPAGRLSAAVAGRARPQRRGGGHAPDRLRGRQLRDRLRLRRDPRRRRRLRRLRRGRRGVPQDLHRLLPDRHHGAGALPAVRQGPQGHPGRRGRRRAGAGEPALGPGAGRPGLRRGARLRPQLRRPAPGRAGRGQRGPVHAARARRRRRGPRRGRLHLRPRHRHPGQRRDRGGAPSAGCSARTPRRARCP